VKRDLNKKEGKKTPRFPGHREAKTTLARFLAKGSHIIRRRGSLQEKRISKGKSLSISDWIGPCLPSKERNSGKIKTTDLSVGSITETNTPTKRRTGKKKSERERVKKEGHRHELTSKEILEPKNPAQSS